MVVEEREMGLWVLRETKRGKRDFGVGAAMESVYTKEREKVNFDRVW